MPHTNSWDETSPTNTTLATSIDDEIRKLRLDIRERLANDHKFGSSDDGSEAYGIHKKVTLEDKIASPTIASNQTALYAKTDDYECEIRYKDKRGVDSLISFIGEVRMRMGTSVPDGWLALNGNSVGDATSGATFAGTDYQNLYYFLYDELDDTAFPITGGRGANAAADWAAHKKGTLPDARSRVPICAGAGVDLTVRTIGYTGGAETYDYNTHTHGMSSHTHSMQSHTHTHTHGTGTSLAATGYEMTKNASATSGGPSVGSTGAPSTANTEDATGLDACNVINPFIVVTMLIRY